MMKFEIVEETQNRGTANTVKNFINSNNCSYLWLAAGMALYIFSTGPHSIWVAQWVFPIFLLRFMGQQTIPKGFATLMIAVSAGFCFSWHHTAQGPFLKNVIIVAGVNGIWTALIFLIDRLVSSRYPKILSILVFPLIWTSMNFLLSVGTEVKWGYIGDAQPLFLLQIASVTGIWSLVFLVTFFASVVHYAWQRKFEWTRIRHVVTLYICILSFIVLMGIARLAFFAPESETVRVACITNPNPESQMIDLGTKRELPTFERATTVLETLSQEAARAQAKIVFWQEYGNILKKEDAAQFIRRADKLAREEKIHLILGMCVINPKAGRDGENKLVYIDSSGNVIGEYHKHHFLVAEEAYHFTLGEGVIKSYQTPVGKIASVFSLDTEHPHFIRQAGKAGVDILLVHAVNFMGNAKIPVKRTRFLAVENGFSMIRCTASGVSAAFDYQGRILSNANHTENDNLILLSDVPVKGTKTIYPRIGDLFSWICVLGSIVLVFLAFSRPASH